MKSWLICSFGSTWDSGKLGMHRRFCNCFYQSLFGFVGNQWTVHMGYVCGHYLSAVRIWLCLAPQMFSACACCFCWLHYTAECKPLWACLCFPETEIGRPNDMEKGESICVFLPHSHTLLALWAHMVSSLPAADLWSLFQHCLWCETRTNYMGAPWHSFTHSITSWIISLITSHAKHK